MEVHWSKLLRSEENFSVKHNSNHLFQLFLDQNTVEQHTMFLSAKETYGIYMNKEIFTVWVYGGVFIKTDTEGHVWQWIYTCDNSDMLLGLKKYLCSYKMGYKTPKNVTESSSKPNQAAVNVVSLIYIYLKINH